MAEVRRKGRERKKKVQYASPVRKMHRHKRKAHNMSSSTSSSGKIHVLNLKNLIYYRGISVLLENTPLGKFRRIWVRSRVAYFPYPH